MSRQEAVADSMSRSSTAKLLLNLQRLVIQAIAVRKQGTIVSALTNADMDEDHLWASIGRDLQVAGISREMVTANRDVIRQQIEYLFGSGLIATDNISEAAESSWEGCSVSRTASAATFGRAASTSTSVYRQAFQYNAFDLQDQNGFHLEKSRGLPTSQTQPSRLGARQTGNQRNELPQCPWPKLASDQLPLTNDDATYRPYVVEIKLVVPPSKSTIHERDGFAFKRNYVSEHSWVFLRLSQHTRDGIRSLSTPDPYNPVQDHGRQFSQKWTEFAFSQAFRDWRHMLLKPDQPVYVCLPSSQENVLDLLARERSLTFPIAFSFDLDTDAIVFWKLARRWSGSAALQYRAKSMDEVPRKGLLQYIKRISLRKQARTLNLEGAQGKGQMLLMLFTQKAIDQSRAWANTWIMEQEFSDRGFGASSEPYSNYSDSLKSSSTLIGSNTSVARKGKVPYGSLLSINPLSHSLPYLAKASAVCSFEASLPNEMSFTSGDEIWITQYVESELWEGINQRTQQKGLFPNTLVKIFLVKKMPSREKMPLEIDSSPHSFGGSPIENTFLSPDSIDGRAASVPNRAHRSASTSDIPSVASVPSPSTLYELDSTPINPASKPSAMDFDYAPSLNQQELVTRITSSASDKGPGRAASQSYSQPQQNWGPTPLDMANQSQLGGPYINRPQSQRIWAPTPLGSAITPAGFREYTVSPSVTPVGSTVLEQFNDIRSLSADITPENTPEPTQAAANYQSLRAKLSAFQDVREAAEIEAQMMSGFDSMQKAQGSEAPPANAGSNSVSSPQLATALVEFTNNGRTDRPENTPSIQPDWPFPSAPQSSTETPLVSSDMEQKMFKLSIDANHVVQPRPSMGSPNATTTGSSIPT